MCVAAMLIWKPPVKPMSEYRKLNRATPENFSVILQMSSTDKASVCLPSASNKDERCFGIISTEFVDVIDGQATQVSEGKSVVSHFTSSSFVVTDVAKTKANDNSLWHHTISVFTNKHFFAYVLNSFLIYFGCGVIFTHLTAYAASVGKSTSFGNLLLSVFGVSSILGRIVLNALCQQKLVSSILLYIVVVALCGKIFDTVTVVSDLY